jgi:hypothetical protein
MKYMETNLRSPTIEDVDRIRIVKDPVIRNLQITQCYHELSVFLASHTGSEANWCTFATWASKQAGQTIRKEDLERLLERALNQSPSTMQASQNVAAIMKIPGRGQFLGSEDVVLSAHNFSSAVDRASDAVARGNKKVFEEIGYEFARFYQACLLSRPPDPQSITGFCEQLRAGQPPDGQDYLRRSFRHYAQALIENDLKARAELMLLANLEIGFHEQTRLQPEIAESMDAGLVSFLDFTRSLFRSIFPANGWFHLAYLYLMRLLGHPTALDLAIQDLLAEVRFLLRQLITETMMTISLPSGVVLKLSDDITGGFPESLKQIANQELNAFLEKHDHSSGGLSDTGALDWANLPDRLNFIIGLFRCYQEYQNLFGAPFTPEQEKALKDGRLPDGRL